jgi:hydroxymethylpyrimidine/phosphomethylpyrimidine kinase
MRSRASLPIALTIAGSDSGGGAGIQADLKTFAALGVHGASVITCLTAQNPAAVLAVQPATPALVRAQLEAVFAELRPQAVKTGMLFSAAIIAEVARFLSALRHPPPLIVDPVMIATSGARLLKPDAIETLKQALLPLATLVTPNVPEAEALTGFPIHEPEDLRTTARLLRQHYRCAVLLKGGHLADARHAVDIFYDRPTELLLSAPYVRGVSTHGTGCTYAAAITAGCARGLPLAEAVKRAKTFISQAVARSRRIGRHWVLDCVPSASVRMAREVR